MAKKRSGKKSFLFKLQKLSPLKALLVIVVVSALGIGAYYVARASKNLVYNSSGISHPDTSQGGHAVTACLTSPCGGNYITVWQSASNPSVYSWIGPGLSQSSGSKKACFSMKRLSTSPAVHLLIRGRKSGASSQTTIKSTVVNLSGTAFKSYCLSYTLGSSFSLMDFDIYVQSGQIQIYRVSLSP